MKLYDSAKKLLNDDPVRFLETYGLHYISDVQYCAHFFGIFNAYEKHKSDKSSIDILSSFTYENVFFSATASEDFKKSWDSSASHMH